MKTRNDIIFTVNIKKCTKHEGIKQVSIIMEHIIFPIFPREGTH